MMKAIGFAPTALPTARAARQLGEIGLLSMMSIQIADHGCHTFVVVHDGILTSRASRAHPVLAAILARVDDLRQLTCKRFIRFAVVLIAPNDKLEHLSADIAPSPQGGTATSASRPIFRFGRGDALIR